jgi:hypothetical protein
MSGGQQDSSESTTHEDGGEKGTLKDQMREIHNNKETGDTDKWKGTYGRKEGHWDSHEESPQ